MLAGSLMTDNSLQQLQQIFTGHGLDSELREDELIIRSIATVRIRQGFAHECILVGHAREHDELKAAATRVSGLLQQQQLAHDYEIYDRDNHLIDSFDYAP